MNRFALTALTLGVAVAANDAIANPPDKVQHERMTVRKMFSGPRLGIGVARLSPELRKALGLPAEGLVVDSVEPQSAAGTAGLKVGDVVTKVDGDVVRDPESVWQALADRKAGEKVAIEVQRDKKAVKLQGTVREGTEVEEEIILRGPPGATGPGRTPGLGRSPGPFGGMPDLPWGQAAAENAARIADLEARLAELEAAVAKGKGK